MFARVTFLTHNPKFSAVPGTENNEISLASKRRPYSTGYEKRSNPLFEITEGIRAIFSAANANSNDDELNLNSNNASNSNDNNRLRVRLALRACYFRAVFSRLLPEIIPARGFCFQPAAQYFSDGSDNFQLRRIPAVGYEFSVQSYQQGFLEQIKTGAG